MASEESHQDHTASLGGEEHEGNQEDENETMSAGDESTSATTFRADLIAVAMACRTDDDYRRLKAQLLEPPPDVPGIHEYVDIDVRGTLLHAILFSEGDIPLDLVKSIVDLGGAKMASQEDIDEHAPLHAVAKLHPQRSDIAEFLIEQYPDAVHEGNGNYSRPIELLSHKVIMMDEAEKYGRIATADIQGVWKTVHAVARAMRPDIEFWQPLIHSCVASQEYPVALLQSAMKRFPEQLNQSNEQGDLPLHLMYKKRQGGINDEFMDTIVFTTMLVKNPGAAEALNHDGMSPLALAIRNGYKQVIIDNLLFRAPASVGTLKLPLAVLPFLYQRLLRYRGHHRSAALVLLKAHPPT